MDSSFVSAAISGTAAIITGALGFVAVFVKIKSSKQDKESAEIFREQKKFITEGRCKNARDDCKKQYDEQLKHGYEQFKSIDDKIMTILNNTQRVDRNVAKIEGYLEKQHEKN